MISKEQSNAAPLYGLVLAGGKSVRMGHDKSIIHWHGVPQRYYMADLLTSLCADVFISCRPEQAGEIVAPYQALPDSAINGGPLAGILSAFAFRQSVAWLVVACDLPLLDKATLQNLITERDYNCIATTYVSPHDGLPEPLISIWEPAAYPLLQAHIADGFKCPRKALIRNEQSVKIIVPPYPQALLNTNTPEDAEQVNKILGK